MSATSAALTRTNAVSPVLICIRLTLRVAPWTSESHPGVAPKQAFPKRSWGLRQRLPVGVDAALERADGELDDVRSVRIHLVELGAVGAAVASEHDLGSVGGPGRVPVDGRIVGQAPADRAVGAHGVDLVVRAAGA